MAIDKDTMRLMGELKVLARQVRDDAEQDARSLDGRPFTGRAVAETFGTTLAMVFALAAAIERLCEDIERRELTGGA